MYLYVLQFDCYCKNTVKIGWANNPEYRLLTLQRTHGNGRILLSSYVGDIANRLEKTLHLLYRDHNVSRIAGDGGTEFFKFEDVGLIVEHINIIAASFNLQNSVEKILENKDVEALKKRYSILERELAACKESLGKASADKYWLMSQITKLNTKTVNTPSNAEVNTNAKQKTGLKKRLLYAILDIEQ